jgi:hypothetical protein
MANRMSVAMREEMSACAGKMPLRPGTMVTSSKLKPKGSVSFMVCRRIGL